MSDYPLYEMIVAGKPEWWPLKKAGIVYDSGWVSVTIGGNVLDEPGMVRPITQQERAKIADIADEWSASK